MPRDRFFLVHRHLSGCEPAEGVQGFDLIRPIVDHFNNTVKQFWQPGKHNVIDDSMVDNKCRSRYYKHVPGKPHKNGTKGYCSFNTHLTKNPGEVWDLLLNEGYVWHAMLQGVMEETRAPPPREQGVRATRIEKSLHRITGCVSQGEKFVEDPFSSS